MNPAQTLADIASSLGSALQGSTGDFNEIAGAMSSSFDSAADLFTEIAQSDKILMSLDATLDFSVNADLSLSSFSITSTMSDLRSSFTAYISDSYDFTAGGFHTHITPSVLVFLEANNTATPFDVFATPNALTEFAFGGTFDGMVAVAVDGIPAQVTLRASSDDITKATSLQFEARLDIDLHPIKSECNPLIFFTLIPNSPLIISSATLLTKASWLMCSRTLVLSLIQSGCLIRLHFYLLLT